MSPAEMARLLREAQEDMRAGHPEAADPKVGRVAASLEDAWPAESAGAVMWERAEPDEFFDGIVQRQRAREYGAWRRQ